jgi:predicted lysophospholipase L1 biosynthesis ABC-type transport system permease subunit
MEWLLQRLKALAAALVPLIVAAIMKGIEQVFSIDIPADWEAWILAAASSLVGGIAVHSTPNLSGRQAKEVMK